MRVATEVPAVLTNFAKIFLRRLFLPMIDSPTGGGDRAQAASNPSLALILKDHLMRKLIKRFRRDEEGAALVEYGLLVGLIAVVCITAVTTVGTDISNLFAAISTDLANI